MATNSEFTLLDLLDLALRMPEVGAVNFNILHTALTCLVLEMGMQDFKPRFPLDDFDAMAAKIALKMGRASDPHLQWREHLKPGSPQRVVKETIIRTEVVERKEPGTEEAQQKKDGEGEVEELLETLLRTVDKKDDQQEEVEEVLETLLGTVDKKDDQKEETVEKKVDQQEEVEELLETLLGTVDKKDDQQEEVKELLETLLGTVDKKDDQQEEVKELLETLVVTVETGDGTQSQPENVSELTGEAKRILDGHGKDPGKLMAKMMFSDQESSSKESPEILQEMWRTVNVNKRIDAMEEGITEVTNVVDCIWDKVQELEEGNEELMDRTNMIMEEYLARIVALEEKCKDLTDGLQAANEYTTSEIKRLEDMIGGLRSDLEAQSREIDELRKCLENCVTKEEFEEKIEELMETFNSKIKELKKRIRELLDQMVRKEDFMELLSRVESIEEDKVSREELGELLNPGFIEKFIAEHRELCEKLEKLIEEVHELEFVLDSLVKRIDEEIMKYIEETFAELRSTINSMLDKLDKLDADDISDSFARLEELADSILKDVDNLKLAQGKLEKDLKASLKKIADLLAMIEKLEALKADKKRMYELLETKADLELLLTKVDKTEFAEVVTEIQENHDRLKTQVKMDEEEMREGFIDVRHELSFKMYTEDFVVGTEPIRNRIKAILYEQKRIKELILTNLFPDAPGVTKCFSCKRAATLKGASGDDARLAIHNPKSPSPLKALQESPQPPSSPDSKNGASMEQGNVVEETMDGTKSKSGYPKLPPIDDLDSVPIPPADHPRTKDIHQLPVILANARPQVGLQYQKSRKAIDSEIETYFAAPSKFPIVRGEYTKTNPQQRGLSFQTMKLPVGKKSEVLLESPYDNKYYKGALYTDGPDYNTNAVSETKVSQLTRKSSKNCTQSAVIVLKGGSQETQSTPTVPVPSGKPKNVTTKVIPNKP